MSHSPHENVPRGSLFPFTRPLLEPCFPASRWSQMVSLLMGGLQPQCPLRWHCGGCRRHRQARRAIWDSGNPDKEARRRLIYGGSATRGFGGGQIGHYQRGRCNSPEAKRQPRESCLFQVSAIRCPRMGRFPQREPNSTNITCYWESKSTEGGSLKPIILVAGAPSDQGGSPGDIQSVKRALPTGKIIDRSS
jgi:hypothetical protein